ncbi:MAG TPA: hypothetical protein VGA21_15415 [Cyclobacteriaceae bacterium]|jgi:hypothetical protein
MSQERLQNQLFSLERKVRLLVGEYKKLKEEIIQVKGENDTLGRTILKKEQQIGDFQNKINISKIVDSIAVDDVKAAELKKNIDLYIKEIDKCISHLSR